MRLQEAEDLLTEAVKLQESWKQEYDSASSATTEFIVALESMEKRVSDCTMRRDLAISHVNHANETLIYAEKHRDKNVNVAKFQQERAKCESTLQMRHQHLHAAMQELKDTQEKNRTW